MLLRIGCATRLVPSGLSHTDRKRSTRRQTQLRTVAEGRRPDQNPRSRKGASLENKKRRKGRPAWTRKPDDTPFRSEASVSLLVTKAGYQPGSFCRDGNRDRLVGLLTERAARTLCYYLSETNLNVHHWLMSYMQRNPIPRSGTWDDVSGETFLRTLLSMPLEHAKWTTGRDPLFDNIPGCGVDPRNLAQRVMAIRSQLSLEFIEDLRDVSEENSTLLRESLVSSLSMSFDDMPVAEKPVLEKDSPQSANKKESSVVADKKDSAAIKKDTPGTTNQSDSAVSANKKNTIPPASKKATSGSAADSAASAIASLQRSFESLPVAEKPVLKEDTTPSASKEKPVLEEDTTSPASKEKPVLREDTTPSASKENPVLEQDTMPSASTEKPVFKRDTTPSASKEKPVLKKDTTPSASKEKPVLKKDTTPSASKKKPSLKKDTTPSASKKKTVLKKDTTPPVSADKKGRTVSSDKNANTTPSDSKVNPVSADTSVSMDGETSSA